MVATKTQASKKSAPAKAHSNGKVSGNGRPEKKADKSQPCTCGCEGMTKGGKFIPGHDARLKGVLQTAHRSGGLSPEQRKLVEELSWERFLERPTDSPASATQIKLGLSTPQVHILKALEKAPSGLTRSQIKDKSKVSLSMTSQLGPVKAEDVSDKDGSLLARKLCFVKADEQDGKMVQLYFLSAAGKKSLEQLKAK